MIELQDIVDYLSSVKIRAVATDNLVLVNRDDMCNSEFHKGGLPESGTYVSVLYAVEEKLGIECFWGGKTDDNYMLCLRS